MAWVMVCPWAGPITSVRRINISRVPWRMSPASGGLFMAMRSLHSNAYGKAWHSNRMAMGRDLFARLQGRTWGIEFQGDIFVTHGEDRIDPDGSLLSSPTFYKNDLHHQAGNVQEDE